MSARGSAGARVARRAAPGRVAARPRVPAGSRDPGRTLIPAVAIALITGLAAAAFWPVYRDASFVRMAGITLVVGALLAVAGARFRWGSAVVAGAILVAFLALGVPLAVPTGAVDGWRPTLAGLGELVEGASLGIVRLLTIALPVGDYQALLVPAFALVLLGSVIGVSVALRSRRPELAVIPSLVILVVAAALGPDRSQGPDAPDAAGLLVPVALAWLATALLWIARCRWRRRHRAMRRLGRQAGIPVESASDRRRSGTRAGISAVVVLAAALAAGVAATGAAPPDASRTGLRSTVEQPFDPREQVSPLSSFRTYWKTPTVDETLLTVAGLPVGGRVRLAALDTYDGVVYGTGGARGSVDASRTGQASGTFARVPYRLDQTGVAGDDVTLDVVVDAYRGVWLPGAGRLERIAFAGDDGGRLADSFYYDDATATGAVIGGLTAGDAYEIEAVVASTPPLEALADERPGDAVAPRPTGVPDEIAARVEASTAAPDGATAGNTDAGAGTSASPGAQLVAAISALRADGYVSHGVGDAPFSRSGHSAERIADLLTTRPMLGDAEQYAVAAALMADDLGFPVRVVMGFAPGEAAVREALGGPVRIQGSDVTAWIEVDTASSGWVAVDPNPPVRDVPDALPDEPTEVARPQTVLPPPVEEQAEPEDRTPPDASRDDRPEADPALQAVLAAVRVAGWSLLGLGLAASPFLAVVGAKATRRRRRRGAAAARDRVGGAWDEFRDGALDRGLVPPVAATRREVARLVGVGGARGLADVADESAFAPGDVPDPLADASWRRVDELAARMDAGRTRRQRLRAMVSLASLRRARGGRGAGGDDGGRARVAGARARRGRPRA
ncbi:transglutaminaseTgpA domain-containing protein [Clavibacter michiganensis]|uniref:transglutaminase domain-containing protein n=1 Tax=Clavibacter michiganensis TaxID=28447 RepID=UPI0026DBFF0B|nr:transglutaminase domain-containing protein [Clavibacter michiganensis]MDO4075817.1 transglutaminaseTgpA domain-containing protein [Clavibacter michiganensis]MDO4130921.1 transglutaminaseTgpA domain-containing protein [Clavibacter michiganensis]MDO4136940.1 transglutaminaseTgpA domain-containing protein [Clavibacter michiganensis]